MLGYVSVTPHNSSLQEKFLENTPVRFPACSTFPQLMNQAVPQFRVNWTALCFTFQRRKLASRIHTNTLWRTNHHV